MSSNLPMRADASSKLGSVERHRHPAARAELIGQNRKFRALDVGEEQGRAARLDDAIGDLADLEPRIDARADDVKLAGLAQRVDELR